MQPATRAFARLWLIVLFVLGATAGFAQTDYDSRSLDGLFTLLRNAPDANVANAISSEIWERWTTPDDPALAERMQVALDITRTESPAVAVETFTTIVEDYPDYAEGWNQRATLYYVLGEYEKSLADIEQVLAREPRHYGALAGQTLIYLQQDRRGLALETIKRALDIHPFLNERRLFPQLMDPPTRT